jgi:lipoprotein-releasing system permease protein
MAVMIITLGVLIGFKQQISEKVSGFLAHIQIVNFDGNSSYETTPISSNQNFLPQLEAIDGIKHIQTYALKPGIITTGTDIQGVVLKGVDADFDWSFFDDNMVEGKHFTVSDSASSNEVCISKKLSLLLQLKLEDRFDMYFIQDPPRVRRFSVSGIYDTQFSEFDLLYVFCDIKQTQRLNNWNRDQVTGFEIYVNDFGRLDSVYEQVRDVAGYKLLPNGSRLLVDNVKGRFVQIFDWLELQDLNAWVILTLMLIVAGFNMISGLLIILLERAGLIGLLKALGMTNLSLQKIFIYQSTFIAGKGLLWGNIFGIGLCLIQKYFGIVSLNPDTYYLSQVPIEMNYSFIILLNVGAITAIVAMLVLPSMMVARINPSKTLRFD